MTEALMQIMYSSVSEVAISGAALDQLFAVSRRNNLRDQITGALMCHGRMNIQFIEGPQAPMLALWQRIQADPRHYCVVQLHQSVAEQPRLFTDWAMLRGKSSRAEMLNLVRAAYTKAEKLNRPDWSMAVGPLLILLDGNFRDVYSRALGEPD